MTSALAIASFVLALLSFVFGFVTGIPAIVLGHLAMRRLRRSDGTSFWRRVVGAGLVLAYFLSIVSVPGFWYINKKLADAKAMLEARNGSLQDKH